VPRFPVSDHSDGERFFNVDRSADRSLADVFRWMRTRERTAWPASVPVAAYAPPPPSVAPGRVAVTFIGHSTFLIRTASAVLITDPVFTSHAGPYGRLGPRRVRSPGIPIASLPPVDIVLVSHNHYDHLQHSSLRHFQHKATYVAPLGVPPQLGVTSGTDLPPKGGSHEIGRGSDDGEQPASASRRKVPDTDHMASAFRRMHELDWWQSAQVGGVEITAVPAQHFSARTPWDRNRTLWCGYVVKTDGVTIYFAGDTGYAAHFAQIGARWPSIDVALLPIGAYEPRWFMIYAHMNPEEAVRAHVEVKARASVGMHFGTFQLTDEAIDEPLRALERARANAGISAEAFRVLGFGESAVF
jgi:L-ascorbate metabolism protein UlaG (beta-lactamase superfamily)